jgi:hypothetical protein
MLTSGNSTVDAQAALAVSKLDRKKKQSTNLNFKTFFKVAAVLVVLLTSYFCFNNTQSYETESHKQKRFDYLITRSFIECRIKNHIQRKEWENNRDLTLDGEAYFQVQKEKPSAYKLQMVLLKY